MKEQKQTGYESHHLTPAMHHGHHGFHGHDYPTVYHEGEQPHGGYVYHTRHVLHPELDHKFDDAHDVTPVPYKEHAILPAFAADLVLAQGSEKKQQPHKSGQKESKQTTAKTQSKQEQK